MERRRGSDSANDWSGSRGDNVNRPDSRRGFSGRDTAPGSDLWRDGLICAFEFVRVRKRSGNYLKSGSTLLSRARTKANHSKAPDDANEGVVDTFPQAVNRSCDSEVAAGDDNCDSPVHEQGQLRGVDRLEGSHWVPIGWERISALAQTVQVDAGWGMQLESMDDDEDLTVTDMAAPYWERPAGPIWWCHLSAGHPAVEAWLRNAQWLHPAVSLALRNEGRLISERMKSLLYEVPVRVAGGLLFELLGQSAGDPFVNENDTPIVLRSWQAQNFLITVLHIKGPVKTMNVLGITEVQELLAGGCNVPRTVHEVIAHLTCCLSRWDDRLFHKSIFGAADEIELKFVNRRNREDSNLYTIILNQEIRRLSRQVIRVKWSLHAREEIVFQLLQHLKGNTTRILLEGIIQSTRQMIDQQEAVRGHLLCIQDVMKSTVRAWLQDRSFKVTHNLTIFGGCGVVLSIITDLLGLKVDGIPGARNTPYAFSLYSAIVVFLGIVLIAVGLLCFKLKAPVTKEQVDVRKLELQELVKMFQHEAETHAQVRKPLSRSNLTPTAGDILPEDANYLLIQ